MLSGQRHHALSFDRSLRVFGMQREPRLLLGHLPFRSHPGNFFILHFQVRDLELGIELGILHRSVPRSGDRDFSVDVQVSRFHRLDLIERQPRAAHTRVVFLRGWCIGQLRRRIPRGRFHFRGRANLFSIALELHVHIPERLIPRAALGNLD